MVNVKSVYDCLVQAAQNGKTVSYQEIGRLMGLNAETPCDRMLIGRVLDEISCNENAQGRPLLSAVAVLPAIGYPEKGFFLLARELGQNTYCDDRSYFAHELKRVHDYWRDSQSEYEASVFLPARSHSTHYPLAVR